MFDSHVVLSDTYNKVDSCVCVEIYDILKVDFNFLYYKINNSLIKQLISLLVDVGDSLHRQTSSAGFRIGIEKLTRSCRHCTSRPSARLYVHSVMF